jgi:tetratricopeptide (TPR) repeat protein
MKRGAAASRPRSAASAPRPRTSAFSLHADPALTPESARRFAVFAFAALAALAIALLAMVFGPHRIGDYMTETDFYGGYAEGATAILHGRLDPSRYGVIGPVYELALALFGWIVRDLFLAAGLLSVVSTVAGGLAWFGTLARRANSRLACFAVLFLGTNATLFRYCYSATTDALAFALQAIALFFLLAAGRPRDAVLAGVAAALAFLTRYSAVYLLPAGLLALALGGTLQPRRARGALLFTAGFAAVVAPWILYSLAHGGTLASQLHHNIAYDVFARARGIPWDEYQRVLQPQFHSLWDVIARDPAAVGRRELFNLGDHLRLDAHDLLGWPVAIAAAAGLVFAVFDGTLRRLWPLWATGALAFLALVPIFYSTRYSLPLLPFYAALAAAAFASPWLALAVGRGRRLPLKPLLAALPLALAVRASAREQAIVIDQLPIEVLESARVLRREARPGDRVITRKAHIAFHGGVTAVAFPFTKTLPQLADYAREKNARWLFFSWPEAETRPDYFFLLDTSAVVPGLTARSVTQPHPAVLYEIGPGFGTAPDWFGNDTLRALHIGRGRLLVNPADVRALYTLGFIARNRGRLDEARGYLERAERVRPGDLPTALLLGEVYLLSNDPARAGEAYRRALGIDPDNVAARVGIGWAALVAGQPTEAARQWRPVIDVTRDGATLQRMVDLYRGLGDAAAEAEARAAIARLDRRR